jgi:hypothetical protein
MTKTQQPAVSELFQHDPESKNTDLEISERIRRLSRQQPFSVLCTQGQGQPYGSLVCYAISEDLQSAVFATSMATHKFRLLTQCDHVAMVIDSRPMHSEDLMEIEAVTLTGRARKLEPGLEYDRFALMLRERHPYLESFLADPACALFCIETLRYLHVCRFREVRQWVPGSSCPIPAS